MRNWALEEIIRKKQVAGLQADDLVATQPKPEVLPSQLYIDSYFEQGKKSVHSLKY